MEVNELFLSTISSAFLLIWSSVMVLAVDLTESVEGDRTKGGGEAAGMGDLGLGTWGSSSFWQSVELAPIGAEEELATDMVMLGLMRGLVFM